MSEAVAWDRDQDPEPAANPIVQLVEAVRRPEEMDESIVGRSALVGAIIGFVATIIGITVAGTLAGIGFGPALGIGAFIGAFGGVGFGFMMGATVPFLRGPKRADVPR